MSSPTLSEVWDKQEEYNDEMFKQRFMSSSDWMENYVHGMTAQLGQLIEQAGWRKHHVKSVEDFGPNIKEELADLTKYIFSMWQIMGFTEQDMLDAMELKGEILAQLLRQEIQSPVIRRRIVMLDLDGVVADFRQGFMSWVAETKWADTLHIKEEEIGLHMDINHNWNYRAYNQAKIEFERDGGYTTLPSIKAVKMAMNTLKSIGWYIIVHTARPYTTYKRIWGDTWTWLKVHDIFPDELHFGYDERIVAASKLQENNMVIAIEDDPVLIKRYAGCGIPVFVYPQPYNTSISFTANNIFLLDPNYTHWDISGAIHDQSEKTYGKQRQRAQGTVE